MIPQTLAGIPITIDSTRTNPYTRFEFMRMPASSDVRVAPGLSGKRMPAEYSTVQHGMRIMMRFYSADVSVISSLTPAALASILRLDLVPQAVVTETPVVVTLPWENDVARWSMWPTGSQEGSEVVTLEDMRVYCVTSSPINNTILDQLPSGPVELRVNPTNIQTYNGFELNCQFYPMIEVR